MCIHNMENTQCPISQVPYALNHKIVGDNMFRMYSYCSSYPATPLMKLNGSAVYQSQRLHVISIVELVHPSLRGSIILWRMLA